MAGAAAEEVATDDGTSNTSSAVFEKLHSSIAVHIGPGSSERNNVSHTNRFFCKALIQKAEIKSMARYFEKPTSTFALSR